MPAWSSITTRHDLYLSCASGRAVAVDQCSNARASPDWRLQSVASIRGLLGSTASRANYAGLVGAVFRRALACSHRFSHLGVSCAVIQLLRPTTIRLLIRSLHFGGISPKARCSHPSAAAAIVSTRSTICRCVAWFVNGLHARSIRSAFTSVMSIRLVTTGNWSPLRYKLSGRTSSASAIAEIRPAFTRMIPFRNFEAAEMWLR